MFGWKSFKQEAVAAHILGDITPGKDAKGIEVPGVFVQRGKDGNILLGSDEDNAAIVRLVEQVNPELSVISKVAANGTLFYLSPAAFTKSGESITQDEFHRIVENALDLDSDVSKHDDKPSDYISEEGDYLEAHEYDTIISKFLSPLLEEESSAKWMKQFDEETQGSVQRHFPSKPARKRLLRSFVGGAEAVSKWGPDDARRLRDVIRRSRYRRILHEQRFLDETSEQLGEASSTWRQRTKYTADQVKKKTGYPGRIYSVQKREGPTPTPVGDRPLSVTRRLANYGRSAEARGAVEAVDVAMEDTGYPGHRTRESQIALAKRALAADYEGEKARLIEEAKSGIGEFREVDHHIANELINREFERAWANNDMSSLGDFVAITERLRTAKTELARTLGVRDPTAQRTDPDYEVKLAMHGPDGHMILINHPVEIGD